MDWSQVDDVDALWQALQRARADSDQVEADAIKARMADLQTTRRYANLNDVELERRIAVLRAKDTPELIDGSRSDFTWTEGYVEKLNLAMEDAAHQVDRSDLVELLAEKRRRLAERSDAKS